jgi:hypothetical protein
MAEQVWPSSHPSRGRNRVLGDLLTENGRFSPETVGGALLATPANNPRLGKSNALGRSALEWRTGTVPRRRKQRPSDGERKSRIMAGSIQRP